MIDSKRFCSNWLQTIPDSSSASSSLPCFFFFLNCGVFPFFFVASSSTSTAFGFSSFSESLSSSESYSQRNAIDSIQLFFHFRSIALTIMMSSASLILNSFAFFPDNFNMASSGSSCPSSSPFNRLRVINEKWFIMRWRRPNSSSASSADNALYLCIGWKLYHSLSGYASMAPSCACANT